MALTGKAKVDYQREYMRRRRSNAGSNAKPESVRPEYPSLDTMREIIKNDPTQGKVTGELTKARQTSSKGFNE